MASTSLLYDGRGKQLGVVAIIRDISETYAPQKQVARADRLAAIGEMAAGIAHELRTPLTSIRGFVQYLQGSTDPKEWKEYGDIIIREVDGLNRIVSELLDLVRSQPVHTVPTDINRLAEEALLLARDNESNRRIAFVVALTEGLPQVEVGPRADQAGPAQHHGQRHSVDQWAGRDPHHHLIGAARGVTIAGAVYVHNW